MRFKGICSECEKTVICLVTGESDKNALADMGDEEDFFEHKCPACNRWANFKIIAIYQDA